MELHLDNHSRLKYVKEITYDNFHSSMKYIERMYGPEYILDSLVDIFYECDMREIVRMKPYIFERLSNVDHINQYSGRNALRVVLDRYTQVHIRLYKHASSKGETS